MSAPARVLITDGELRASLAAVRSLGRAGHAAYVCAARTPSLAGASRWARGERQVPDALAAPGDFVTTVATLCREWRVDVLLPMSEAALLALLPERERLDGVRLPFPAAPTFRRVSDKADVLAAAARLGIAVPAQRVVCTSEDVAALDPARLAFPLVVKPARSVGEHDGRRTKLGVVHAADVRALAGALAALGPDAYPVLLQQRVVGPGVGVFLLLWEGRLVAQFAHRRIREKPPSGGVSVCRESVPADPEVVAHSRALLEHYGWCGVAMVEYKRDEATGTPYLMEINGRFWGSLQLAIDAGVDFPAMLVALALGEPVAPVSRYRVGVRSRWWWGEVDHLLARLRRPGEVGGPDGTRVGRWAAARDFLMGGGRNEVLRLDDPAPFLRETVEWLRGR